MMGKPGRALRSDGIVTRERILESAGELFGSRGLASTTSKAIAAHAEVDLASINYHFGSRDELYRAVLVEAHRRFVRLEELERIAEGSATAEQKLGMLLNAIVGRIAGSTHWSATVLARELAAPSAHISVLRDEEAPPKLQIVLRILHDITGVPIGAPDLLCCLISVAAPCAMLLVAGDNIPVPGNNVLRMDRRTLASHLHRFALAGLHAAGEDYRARQEEDHAQTPA
ncbi:TetR/AcrR family transcriptional regulator [Sphingomonas abaci]|uniref:AcrR family transcriptional regulator n=1 Tax=Sphingomonas abaci TaxID=237611 RepID=A0A7W7AM72_9SPHN|nr:CerR family C-terminal domain-containing protein [Sphingomonas abaci]MBB4619656.1 AcrR family transcriptional regulator [Sphingomonas abaci]